MLICASLKLLKVTGNSMHPTLVSGVFVVVWRGQFLKWQQRLKVGNIVAVNHQHYGQIIKRISQLKYDDNGNVSAMMLQGDNVAASVTEAQMGWVKMTHLIGKVVYVVQH